MKNGDFRGDTNKGVGSGNISSADHVVFHNNNVHIAGDWKTLEDQDTHAMQISTNVSYCWVLDNSFSRSSGDGIQINAGSVDNQPNTHHIYIGRNESFENKQNGFWTKQANDVIFSENIAHDHVVTTSAAPGVGLGGQYGPERVWFIYNKVYNNYGGISVASRSGGIGEYLYFIGNEIYDNNLNPSYDVNNSWANAGITVTGGKYVSIINNVLANNSGGINTPVGNAEFQIYNNIIDEGTAPGANSIFIYESSTASLSSMDYNIFNNVAVIRWGRTAQDNLSSFQSSFNKGLNCKEIDPEYIDPQNGDFTLQSTSPAIDAGNVNAAYDTFFNLYGIDIKVDANSVSRPQNGTWDIGAFEYSGTTSLSTEEDIGLLPKSFDLRSYPNPFNPSTVVRYDVPQACNVELQVYDISGRQVARIDSGYRSAGTHTISWNARDDKGRQIASDIYLLHIQAGNYSKTIKMMYLK